MESFAIYTELFLFDFLTFFELMEQDYKDYKKLAHEPIYALATYTSTTLQIQRVAKNYKNLFYLDVDRQLPRCVVMEFPPQFRNGGRTN